jgi:glycosyltransferase involved in cell wall biosynthesis
MIVGKPKWAEDYWNGIRQTIERTGTRGRIIEKIEYVPDEATEVYFKSADVLILPYAYVFQSGVLFLGYSFGLPVIAADVGSLREEIIEAQTGFIFKAHDASDLAKTIRKYFASDLFTELESRRSEIKKYARDRYSWDKVAAVTETVYLNVLQAHGFERD